MFKFTIGKFIASLCLMAVLLSWGMSYIIWVDSGMDIFSKFANLCVTLNTSVLFILIYFWNKYRKIHSVTITSDHRDYHDTLKTHRK